MALLRGPAPPRKFYGALYFRGCLVEGSISKLPFAVAIMCQILLILFPPPVWNVRPPAEPVFSPQFELTWYGPTDSLPAILPSNVPAIAPARPPRETAAVEQAPPEESRPEPEVPRPGRTIITEFSRPTHPRQTLIQPAAPPEPPKFLPPLPNIVRLSSAQPVRPKLQLTPEQLAGMRPQAPASRDAAETDAPAIPLVETTVGALTIPALPEGPPKPALPITPMSAPRTVGQMEQGGMAAPELAGAPSLPGVSSDQLAGDQLTGQATLIALSATPAPVAPPPEIPAGNLSARISIGPEGTKMPSAGGSGPASGDGATGASAGGPEGIFISGGRPGGSASSAGLEIGSAARSPAIALPARPSPGIMLPRRDPRSVPSGPAPARVGLGTPAEPMLGPKHVYSMHVNMPNLTSAMGSWILNFAELDELQRDFYSGPEASALTPPVAVRKVDPKYPPELRTAHIDGEVVLYAIIRKDGTVDSIQLVRGIDPRLDTNAMQALAQWKFKPAERAGSPLDLEAVVHIPFRSRLPSQLY